MPWIMEAPRRNRQKHFVIDGEAVILGVNAYSDFNALHSGKHNDEVQLLAFDSWQWTAMIGGICRCQCARPILLAFLRGDRRASS